MAKSGFVSPDPNPKQSGGRDKIPKHASSAKLKSGYPQTSSFASASIPDKRTGGRSKTKHPGFTYG